MVYRPLLLNSLIVNPANDRHGELENETAAIANLFASHEAHMKSLARDLTETKEVFEPPLVYPKADKYIVADGNRRTTCLKLLVSPKRAPTVELQRFFAELQAAWNGAIPKKIVCRLETNRDRVDEILFRRHTGVQGGIGQAKWTDRMKDNFVIRTGKKNGINVADEVEKLLKLENSLPKKKIPRSNLNRLLSSEALRNRVGISIRSGKMEVIRDHNDTVTALTRITTDLADQKITLDEIWDTESKLAYLDKLDSSGILPTLAPKAKPSIVVAQERSKDTASSVKKSRPSRETPWPHLIPNIDYEIVWTGALQRHKEIWEELQYELDLSAHRNAISVLFRVLIELSVENYIRLRRPDTIHENDKLAKKIIKISKYMLSLKLIEAKYVAELEKINQAEHIVSMDTLHRYVHSPNFNVSPDHLRMIWGTMSEFVVLCLNVEKA